MSWIEYWNGKPSIYVSAQHKRAHYKDIADGIIAHLTGSQTVLDYGCGEAMGSQTVASHCQHLYLYDAAPSVRELLASRFEGSPSISILDDRRLDAMPPASVDLVIVNSVVQYLDTPTLEAAFEVWRRLLTPAGQILVADVIPRSVGPLTDASALMRFAAREGFALAAAFGLVRTFFSDYRKLRASYGLSCFDEAEFVAFAAQCGLEAFRVHPNIGHNQSRMAFRVQARHHGGMRNRGEQA